ncbi:MAG: hypothetical protein ACTSO6_12390 [Promethearchaeota archaeon]
MRDLKRDVWIVPYLGLIICSIALFTPAAFFENIIWNHEIIKWMMGFFQNTFNSIVNVGFYEEALQLVPSVIASSIVILSILIIGIGLSKHRNDLKKGSINLPKYIIPAICIIGSTTFWVVMMEIAERNIYDLSMWGRYVPSFGVIGLFIGAALIIFGSLLTKFIKIP